MASDTSSPSSTPLALTPESTGTGSPPIATAGEEKRAKRRQTAFYPNNLSGPNKPPPKPFSRSAAKRQSVLALGSIEHLQYYFTKTGLTAEKNPNSHKGLVPALGGLTINTSASERDDLPPPRVIQLPPTPVIPEPKGPAFPPYVKTYETDPASLLPGVIDDLGNVAGVWGDSDERAEDSKETVDILRLLKTTTRMIRSVRNYVLSLPPEQFSSSTTAYRRSDASHAHHPNQHQHHHQPTPPRSPADFTGSSQHTRDGSTGESEGQRRIRRAALDTLSVLRELEERSRIAREDEPHHNPSPSNSPPQRSSSQSLDLHPGAPPSPTSLRTQSPPTVQSVSPTPYSRSTYSVPVWSDDESEDGIWEEGEEKEGWDARLSRLEQAGGYLYRSDMLLSGLGKERSTVRAYLDVVDDIIFGGRTPTEEGRGERGWERERRKIQDREKRQRSKKRRTSAGDAENRGRNFSGISSNAQRRVSMPARVLGDTQLSEEPLGEGEGAGMENIQEEDEGEEEHPNGCKATLESEESIDEDDEELPEWARRTAFMDSELDRAHCLLHDLLPANLRSSLAPISDGKEAFLASLVSGQLLCVAYNAGVRRSKKPWGYVNRDGIHDIIALEQQHGEDGDGKKGWTFRRTENLRFWVGALGLRYMLPIAQPVQALPIAPTTSHQSSSVSRTGRTMSPAPRLSAPGVPRVRSRSRDPQNSLFFDAKVVATKSEGWESMLEAVLLKWVGAVVKEERERGRR